MYARSVIPLILALSLLTFGCGSSSGESSTVGQRYAGTDAGTMSYPAGDTGSPGSSEHSWPTRQDAGSGAAMMDAGGAAYFPGADGGASMAGPMDDVGAAEQEPDKPEPNEGDNYEPPGTNPFVMAAHDPLSTFAADVDTASYDIFRRDINDGRLPQPASVRLEEFVNYFPYDYEAPPFEGEVPFSITLSAAASPFRAETTLMRVGIQGKEIPPGEKKPLNLVFLVDVSGSMSSSDKLPLVKLLLIKTLDVLEPNDTVSIVTYASWTGVRLPPTQAKSKSTIVSAINGLGAGGSTAGAAGINLAYEQAEAAYIDGGVNHVLLCTDGDFNVGTSSTEALIDLIEDKRKTGITLTVIGFGVGNLNDEMMEAVSNAGDGVYAHISDQDQAVSYAHERMGATFHRIAKDMKIQVEFNPLKVLAYRLLGYENRAIADHLFRDDTVDAGEVGAGLAVTALYELVLEGNEVPTAEGAPEIEDGEDFDGELTTEPDDLAIVRVRYKDVEATETTPAYEVKEVVRPDDVAELEKADADFRWAAAIAAFAEVLKESPFGDTAHLDTVDALLKGGAAGDDPERLELIYLFDLAVGLLGN